MEAKGFCTNRYAYFRDPLYFLDVRYIKIAVRSL
jgi:hypothetical protein